MAIGIASLKIVMGVPDETMRLAIANSSLTKLQIDDFSITDKDPDGFGELMASESEDE